jgi:hypothetical protein
VNTTAVTTGLIVRLEAKDGREADLAAFLESALTLVAGEPETVVWLAIRVAAGSFAIVDAFPDDGGRRAHLDGPVAAALLARADELLARPPVIEQVDVIAARLP